MSNNAHDLTNRLLNALDSNYNVVDMQAVNEIICILEKINITKELLETTRLGKHVNELRRRTGDAALARRAKVLVKRWRDLVIPTVASPKNNNTGSNRSSAERQVRRLGGTPLTSPALSRLVVSPAVASPRPPSRPAWGGYESDSQDVILVDDDASPVPLPGPVPLSPAKRAPSPEPVHDDKKAKRDKKPKKRKGHSRAGSEAASTWGARNGDAHKNGCKPLHKLLPRGKKVKTTQELLEEIQSRGNKPASPDVLLVEPDAPAASPARNGGSPAESAAVPPAAPSPSLPPRPASSPSPPACVCGDDPPLSPDSCPAASRTIVLPWHVTALHHAWLPGVNGTLAPPHESQFHTRSCSHPEHPDLFASVVPLYKYQDYAADSCVKNMVRVPLCSADEKPSVSDSDSVKCSGDRVKCGGDSVKCSEDSVKFSGDSLYAMCSRALSGIPYNYGQTGAAPVLSLRGAEQSALLAALAPECAAPRDALGRPERAPHFAEWHECATLGDLVALPYVVID